MAGFDLQVTGDWQRRLTDLHRWFERVQKPLTPQLLQNAHGPSGLNRDSILVRSPEYVAHFERHAAVVKQFYGPREAGRIERVLRNMTEYRVMLLDRDISYAGGTDGPAAFVRSYNRRERVNADNLLWLANEYYAGRKIVIWSHNVHAVNGRFALDYSAIVEGDSLLSLESTGRLLKLALGGEYYAIATVARGGEWGFPNHLPQPVARAAERSLEHLLAANDAPVQFLDLRTARAKDHWLGQPLLGSLSAQVPNARYPIVWPVVFDGVLFVDHMTPATRFQR